MAGCMGGASGSGSTTGSAACTGGRVGPLKGEGAMRQGAEAAGRSHVAVACPIPFAQDRGDSEPTLAHDWAFRLSQSSVGTRSNRALIVGKPSPPRTWRTPIGRSHDFEESGE